jgi:hypothetical protein
MTENLTIRICEQHSEPEIPMTLNHYDMRCHKYVWHCGHCGFFGNGRKEIVKPHHFEYLKREIELLEKGTENAA